MELFTFGIELLKCGIQISIGNSETTNLGNDTWLPVLPPRSPLLLPDTDQK